MQHTVNTNWEGNHRFVAMVNDVPVVMDSTPGQGASPKKLLLAGLAGCTGIDVVDMLQKMRALPETFRLEVVAELTDEHPKVYSSIHLRYIFGGPQLDAAKIEKAVTLSKTKYCGVSAMLVKASNVTFEVVLQPA
jgi:putative redox protein